MLSISPWSIRRNFSGEVPRDPLRCSAVRPSARSAGQSAATLGGSGSTSLTMRSELRGAVALGTQRPAPGEQLVEEDAERVHVGCGRDRLSAHLLRARILRCHGAMKGSGEQRRLAQQLGLEELGDAEIEELRGAVGRHQDIRGLEVPVHDEVLVGVLDGTAYGAEDLQALRNRQLLRVAIAVDRLTLDVFEDEVGHALLGRPAVEQPRHVGMVEGGQDLPLAAEAGEQLGRLGGVGDLDRHPPLELIVVAHGQEDTAHAPLPQLADDPIGARAGAHGRRRAQHRRGRPHDLVRELGGITAGGDQGLDLLPELRIPGARIVQEGRPFRGIQTCGAVEDVL